MSEQESFITNIINPDRVRKMIRDEDSLNVLLSYQEQFEDEDIYDTAEDIEDEIMSNFPSLMVSKKIPRVAVHYLVVSFLSEALSHQELRNQMRIDDDNVGNIDFSNKSQQYIQIAQMYKQKAMDLLQKMAATNYYKEMWGDVSSDSYLIEGSL